MDSGENVTKSKILILIYLQYEKSTARLKILELKRGNYKKPRSKSYRIH